MLNFHFTILNICNSSNTESTIFVFHKKISLRMIAELLALFFQSPNLNFWVFYMTIKTGNKAEIWAEIPRILLSQFYLLVFIENLHSSKSMADF